MAETAILCEKSHEISRHFFDFWLPNALLAANLSGNPANLWVNGAFLGDDRPYGGVGMVLYGPFINPCGALRETAYGLLQAERQTFHGEVANLPGKAQADPPPRRYDWSHTRANRDVAPPGRAAPPRLPHPHVRARGARWVLGACR